VPAQSRKFLDWSRCVVATVVDTSRTEIVTVSEALSHAPFAGCDQCQAVSPDVGDPRNQRAHRSYDRTLAVLKWTTLSLFAYLAALFAVDVPWQEALVGMMMPPITWSGEFLPRWWRF
jgi:hypothetical protein